MIFKSLSKFIIIAFLYILITSSNNNEKDNDVLLKKNVSIGFQHIYNFEFNDAIKIINKIKKSYYKEPITYILSANYYWWLIISGEDSKENRDYYLKELDSAIRILKSKKNKDLSNLEIFYLINSYALKSRLELLDKQYFESLLNMNECVCYIKSSQNKENQFEPFNLTSGLYNYYIDYGLKNYLIFYPILIIMPEGSKSDGIKLLEKASLSNDVFLNTEGNYFLFKIYFEIEKDYAKALKYANILTNKYKENLVYQYLYLKFLIENKNTLEIKKQIAKINNEANLNSQITIKQKKHFMDISIKDISNQN